MFKIWGDKLCWMTGSQKKNRARSKYRRFHSTITVYLRLVLTCGLKLWDDIAETFPYINFQGYRNSGKALMGHVRAHLFDELKVGDHCRGRWIYNNPASRPSQVFGRVGNSQQMPWSMDSSRTKFESESMGSE